MPSQVPGGSVDRAGHNRPGSATPSQARNGRNTPGLARKDGKARAAQDAAGLKNYQLGDCLGKGAFGSVYRALNWGTGETVAVKQVKLADLPKSELRVIMLEIDLLKNLNHPNIVKYHGFEKTAESLFIVLEYCENGSLHSICKNFGKFPENLVALYMSQVLHGLLYLHEQGVIHRDIKGANILTTKEGLVKLADFGVATRTTGLHESSVVGTPYWMAPEVIELSGATTASDIWSLGCTVIELLDGKPPYHKLQPMPALFRIVNDDHPPLPEGASPAVRDFLMQCFQKDPNLRVSARKLLKHPWIVSARRTDATVPSAPTKYDETVKSVQEWNEALKSPNAGSLRRHSRPPSSSPIPERRGLPRLRTSAAKAPLGMAKPRATVEDFRSSQRSTHDNWDDDFASAISPSALQLPHLRPHDNFGGMLSSDKLKAFASAETAAEEENWDDNFEGELTMKSPLQIAEPDPMQTIRPYVPKGTSPEGIQHPLHSRSRRSSSFDLEPQLPEPRLQRLQMKAPPPVRPAALFRENSVEDYSDLVASNDSLFEKKLINLKKGDSLSPKLFHPSDLKSLPRSNTSQQSSNNIRRHGPTLSDPRGMMRRTRSSIEIQRYAEDEEDEDFSDIFEKPEVIREKPESDSGSEHNTLMLNSKLSNNSWLGDEDDEDDPFAQLEEDFDELDLEANIARDKYARLCMQVEGLVGSLKVSQEEDTLEDLTEKLIDILAESPETKNVIISAHGMLPILEILETCKRRDVILRLLKIVNTTILSSVEIQENLCFVGGIPIISKFASKKYSSEIRLEAAAFVRQMYQTSTLTLQMFISCGGLNVLVEFLEEDYDAERDLVLIGVNGVWSVFELQGPTPKNDFCRIFSRSSVLYPLSMILNRVLDEEGELAELCEGRIANIFLLFSQAENHVKELVADRKVLKLVLKDLKRMTPSHQITMLKFIKNLSMLSTTLDTLQNSNAIDDLIDLLSSNMRAPHVREISNQVLNTMYNLCRLNKTRQEDAALNGIIPLLLRIVKTERPLKEFALPILCDMAHSGKVGRKHLWQNKGLQFYISLLEDPYWQVTALDAIFVWLQEETAKVEERLLDGAFTEAIVQCFTTSKANAFENLLEPLQKLLRLSPTVALSLARADLFSRILQKLTHHKAVVRLNLLRIVRSICDASDERGGLIRRYGLLGTIRNLAETDPAVLVRNMASELVKSGLERELQAASSSRRPITRRSSAVTTPPGPIRSQSTPLTPQYVRSGQWPVYADGREGRQRSGTNMTPVLRPMSREGGVTASGMGSPGLGKSRLPRTSGRIHRPSLTSSPSKDEHAALVPGPLLSSIQNSRRRRQTSDESRWP
ncbi:cytokinesis protein sepH [Xylona heveae TC161]|uniref:non-specific serine/threonine protein kinase n=1 Tax=Xylona heveae (strain CBS 132557 / TC161) TaxID=1328760 RepID=A0A165J352_XYLHT|nr:cytokinesis protein sepH [Xylona heveae TC161]KZF25666.1 cytokinesis protein sepH [Xylona heveae TC161]